MFQIVSKNLSKHFTSFCRHGKVVARYPWIFIVGILILSTICSLGIITFRWENNIVRLWNPKHSETLKNFDWLWKNHPPDLRRHSIIFHGDNVLDPETFRDAFRIRELLYSVTSDEGVTWPQACLKVNNFAKACKTLQNPKIDHFLYVQVPLIPTEYQSFVSHDETTTEEDPFAAFESDDEFEFKETKTDFSVDFYPEPYCTIFNSLEDVCFEDSIFELFAQHGHLDPDLVQNLSKDDILKQINAKPLKSGIFQGKKYT